MKITDITLPLFAWNDLPQISYGAHAAGGGESKMGLLAVETDEGVTETSDWWPFFAEQPPQVGP